MHMNDAGLPTESQVFLCPELKTVQNPAGKLSAFFKDIMQYNDDDDSNQAKRIQKKQYQKVSLKNLPHNTSGDGLRPGAITRCFPYVPMDIIKFSSGHAQEDQTDTIWRYNKPGRVMLNNCAVCLAGFIPEEYGKVSRCNQPANFKHLAKENMLSPEELESMCDLQFNITDLTHQRLNRDGDMQECIHFMLAEQILWYNTKRKSVQMKTFLISLLRSFVM